MIKPKAKLYIVRGIPGSGKSTLAQQIAKSFTRSEHFEADMYFMRNGIYDFDVQLLGPAHRWCLEMTRRTLQDFVDHEVEDSCVIVSNTFTRLREMDDYFDIARELNIIPSVVLAWVKFFKENLDSSLNPNRVSISNALYDLC
jgi:tRNA uridine 5-carbamoylmethylation protein Kti12